MIEELKTALTLSDAQVETLTAWVKDNVLNRTAGFTVTAEDVEQSEIKDEGFQIELKRLKAGSEAASFCKLTQKSYVQRPDGKQDMTLQFKIQALK